MRKDCTVRALSLVTGVEYDEVVAVLRVDGYRPGRGFDLDRWLTCRQDPTIGEPESIFGYRAEWVPLPVLRGELRLTAETFAARYPAGRYILRQARHVCAVINGVVVQETRRDGACVYGAVSYTHLTLPTTPYV